MQKDETEIRLEEALRLLEDSRDIEQSKQEFPDHAAFLEDYWRMKGALWSKAQSLRPADSAAEARSRLLSAVSADRKPHSWLLHPLKLGAVLLGGGLILTAALGASAAGVETPRPASQILGSLGITTQRHGEAVSGTVHEALTQVPPGPERGRAVAEAACKAAHDRSTLPPGAQNAPGLAGGATESCSRDDVEVAESENLPPGLQGTVPGPERAKSAREAACAAARQQLAPGAPEPEVCGPFVPEAETETDDGPPGGGPASGVPQGPGRGQAAREAACQQAQAQQAPGSPPPGVCGPRDEDDE